MEIGNDKNRIHLDIGVFSARNRMALDHLFTRFPQSDRQFLRVFGASLGEGITDDVADQSEEIGGVWGSGLGQLTRAEVPS